MLALSDEALARLAIGATRLRSNARARWLRELARRLDPPPLPPTRQERWRQRQRNGCSVYKVELHDEPVIAALIKSGRLTEREAEQHPVIEAAIAAVVEDWCERWRDKD